jgi:hypothetical protein
MIDRIINIVETETDVTFDAIKSMTRKREVVEARIMLTALIMVSDDKTTYTAIGALLSKDHSSIIYYAKRHGELMEFEREYRRRFRMIHAALVGMNEISGMEKSLEELERLILHYQAKVNEYKQILRLKKL